MRIVVHDYSGHPFQVQLSRELAHRGHSVLHLYFESFQTPKGAVRRRPGDSCLFEVEGLRFEEQFSKYDHFARRRRQEIRYGRLAARRIAQYMPDLVLSSNTPLDAQNIIQAETRRLGARFVFWLQDIYSAGIDTFLRKRHFPAAGLVGAWYRRLESEMLRRSDSVVAISADFRPVLDEWRVDPGRIHVIENWAPFDELPPQPRDNLWSRSQDLAGRFVFLYSGTIGMKHNPELLIDLAESMRDRPDVAVAVISDGVNADRVRKTARARGLANLRSLPLQPYELMPEVLSSGSVLTALLGQDAGAFSVPSKVLSYMCAGKALLLSVPSENAAARIVRDNSAGLVTPPDDSQAFIGAANSLYMDAGLRARCAANAGSYARKTFDIQRIVRQFEAVFKGTGMSRSHPGWVASMEAAR